MSGVQLSFKPEDEWHGELLVTVEADGFAGRGSAWFNTEALMSFCQRLGDYPLDANALPSLQGGYWSEDGKALTEMHVSIRVSPHGASGALAVCVAVAEPTGRVHFPYERREARVWFIVGYNELERFRLGFERVLKGEADRAVLHAVPPG